LAKKSDHLADGLETDNTGGVLSGLLAEEDELDRRALWRLGSWGVGAVAAVVVAVMANQTQSGWKRDQMAAADLSQRAQQIQNIANQTEREARGSPPPSIRSTAIATGSIPASPRWNRDWIPSPARSPGRIPAPHHRPASAFAGRRTAGCTKPGSPRGAGDNADGGGNA
jgi:type II secretory pathway pseudopilin PulG